MYRIIVSGFTDKIRPLLCTPVDELPPWWRAIRLLLPCLETGRATLLTGGWAPRRRWRHWHTSGCGSDKRIRRYGEKKSPPTAMTTQYGNLTITGWEMKISCGCRTTYQRHIWASRARVVQRPVTAPNTHVDRDAHGRYTKVFVIMGNWRAKPLGSLCPLSGRMHFEVREAFFSWP